MPLMPDEVLSLPTQEEVFAFLRHDVLRTYRIDVESNSTIRADLARTQETMTLFLQGTAAFVQSIGPIVQEGTMPAETAVKLYTGYARNFKLGKQAEDALDKLAEDAEAKAKQPQKPKPEELKARAEMAKLQADMQAKQQQAAIAAQAKSQEHQMKLAELQAGLQAKAAELQMKARELQMQERSMQLEAVVKAQQVQTDMAVETQKARLGAATSEHKARTQMAMQEEKARQLREKPKGFTA